MLLGVLNVPSTLAADKPSYLVKGEVVGSTFTVQVYLQNTLALGGRLAIAYDKDILELANASSLSKAVKQASGVNVTSEGHDDSVLVGDGHVMFSWYASKYSGLNATSADKLVATITFTLKDGASATDFSRNTLGLYYVNGTMVDGWDSSCEIIANTNGTLTAYRNTEVNENYLSGISYDYPNCEYAPPVTYNVAVNVKNADGRALTASVLLDSIENETDIYGDTSFNMQSGTYFYRVTAPGYEVKNGYFIVSDKDEVFNIRLRSYGQLARELANGLKIGYADGDNAQSVTTDLILPSETEYGTVTWQSNNGAVSEYGGVSRGDDDIPVTLTATVNVNGVTAVREFEIIVKSRLTAEQKNQAVVSQDKADLEIGFAPGDSADYVTVGLTLPEMGKAGSSISWESSNENIVSYTGAVMRPDDDTTVTLTATIIRGTVYDTKTFTVLVKGVTRPATPAETETPKTTETPAVTATPSKTDAPTVTQKPTPSEEPDDEDLDVEPTPQVINETLDESNEIVQRILNSLEIGYDKNDSAESVKSAITLPTVGSDNTKIVWTSSMPAVITPYGGVVRQAEDTEVILTATITRGSVTEQRMFTLIVKAADEIPQNPSNGQEEEIETKNSTRRGGGSGGGGGGAGTNETAEATATPTTTPTTEPTATTTPTKTDTTDSIRFIDIDNVPWAQNAINALADRGVISGTDANTYSPHNNIRRADFIMLLVRLYDIDAEITETFEDVTEDKYYYSDVSKAKSLGIISGVDETHFNPESSITRQDMMTMTNRALIKLGKVKETEDTDLTVFKDSNLISGYAIDAVKLLVGIGAIHGDTDGNLNPLANTTRAETAVFLFGLTQ